MASQIKVVFNHFLIILSISCCVTNKMGLHSGVNSLMWCIMQCMYEVECLTGRRWKIDWQMCASSSNICMGAFIISSGLAERQLLTTNSSFQRLCIWDSSSMSPMSAIHCEWQLFYFLHFSFIHSRKYSRIVLSLSVQSQMQPNVSVCYDEGCKAYALATSPPISYYFLIKVHISLNSAKKLVHSPVQRGQCNCIW